MKELLRIGYERGYVFAGSIKYPDTYCGLMEGYYEFRKCAKFVIQSAQKDTDWAYRKLGAMAAKQRWEIAKALRDRARKIESETESL